MDIKDTLNLPDTDFQMKANLTEREPEFIKFWQDNRIYQKALEKREEGDKYILHDGPPYANGHIHLGQALNKVIKDITVKYRMIKGYYAPFRPGWDSHGMPIENIVIKEFDEDADVKEVRKRCREFAEDWIATQKEEFIRLGVLGEWDNPYITMRNYYEGKELELFAEIVRKGYVYRGYMPVHWCPTCMTALAISEIEYEVISSPSLTFKMEGEKFNALVWTTTPWTIISNMALAVHPDYTYVIVKVKEEKYLIALNLLEENAEKLGWKNYEIVEKKKGKELEGLSFKHPFIDRYSEIYLANFVTLEEGTGIVHIAPGHGREDYVLGKKYGLDVYSPVNKKGEFTSEVPDFEGLKTEEASKKVLSILKDEGNFIHSEELEHNYPICWRCKDPLIFRATKQWFISIDHNNLREKALRTVNDKNWHPPASEERMIAAVRDRPDWCISRQRKWGVNIPAFYCSSCGEPVLEGKIIDNVADRFKEESSDSWFTLEPEEVIPEDLKCRNCGENKFEKGYDILDVWFDSGVSSLIAIDEDDWPSETYVEGPDQHRGWYNSSLMISLAIKDKAPYDTVVTHGWVLDSEGQSMHKSLGNVTSPDEIVNKYGADILRLWIASVNWTQDIKYGEEIMERLVDAYRKIRNSFRFMLGNLGDFEESDVLDVEDLLPVDRYIMVKFNRLLKNVDSEFEKLNYHRVYRRIYEFMVTDLSSFYMDILKDRLYVESQKGRKRRSAQTVLYHLCRNLAIMLSPILSFTTEEVWQSLFEEDSSVFLSDFPEVREETDEDSRYIEKFKKLMKVRDEFHKALEPAQEDNYVGNSLEVSLHISSDLEELQEFRAHLTEFFIVSDVKFVDTVESEYSYDGEFGSYGIEVAEGEKCERCWMYSPTVNEDENFPGLCERCISIIKGGDFE